MPRDVAAPPAIGLAVDFSVIVAIDTDQKSLPFDHCREANSPGIRVAPCSMSVNPMQGRQPDWVAALMRPRWRRSGVRFLMRALPPGQPFQDPTGS